jgi:hypothetical protein
MFVVMLNGHLQAPGEQPHLAASSPPGTSTPSSPPHRCRSDAAAAHAEDTTRRGRLRCATTLLHFTAGHEDGRQPRRRAEDNTDRELNRDLRPALHDTKSSRPRSLPTSPLTIPEPTVSHTTDLFFTLSVFYKMLERIL